MRRRRGGRPGRACSRCSRSWSPRPQPGRITTRAPATRVRRRSRPRARPPIPSRRRCRRSSVLAYTPFVKEGSGNAREIALTFDDGPGPYTPQLLDRARALPRHGDVLRDRQDAALLRRLDRARDRRRRRDRRPHREPPDAGPPVGAHDQYEQLFEQVARIELLGGRRPTPVPSPVRLVQRDHAARSCSGCTMLMVLWSVDTDDYEQPGVQTIVQRTMEGLHPGAIILLHDGGGQRAADDRSAAADHQRSASPRLQAGDGAAAARRRSAAARPAAAAAT